MIKEDKKDFIEQEIWLLTRGGGFQRANVYANNNNLSGKEYATRKLYFTRMLHGWLKNVMESTYSQSKNISYEQHIAKINSISSSTSAFDDVLTNGKLNFGVSQKLLNLYLKYHWCLGNIPTPPHFPVDRIIQKELGFKEKDLVAWTQMKDDKSYKKIIVRAEEMLKDNTEIVTENITTIAELELKLFKRNEQNN